MGYKRRTRKAKTSKYKKKMVLSLTMMLLIITATIAVTLAYRSDTTNVVVNEFETPEIETNIKEEFTDGITKTNVTATNDTTSDVDVYVRLKFVVQTLEFTDDNNNGEYDEGETGDIVATPSSFDDDGYLENLPITILNVFEVEGLNIDYTGSGEADWFTDAKQETGIYFYKYSLAPGESAYDLVSSVDQEVYYEGVIVRLTVIVDSVQVDGVEDAWVNVNQSGNGVLLDGTTLTGDEVSVAYLDANGNPILYSATYNEEDDATGVPPTESYTDYLQRFSGEDSNNNEEDDYKETQGYSSYSFSLTTAADTTQ